MSKVLDKLVGKTIRKIDGLYPGSEEVTIYCMDGDIFRLYHEQDCCENVELNDVEVDTDNFYLALVISAEEVCGESPSDFTYGNDSHTWTFYKIETTQGGIWMRWLGESNGYYSEEVTVDHRQA